MSSSIITRKEVLLESSKRIEKFDEMWQLTEATMRGEIPFRTSFLCTFESETGRAFVRNREVVPTTCARK